jgi:hypothetical protein
MNAGNFNLKLFTSPTSLSDTLTESSFTAASFPGYGSKTVTATVAGGSGNTTAIITVSTETWTCTGGGSPQTIQGAFLTGKDPTGLNNDLLVASLLPNGPQVVSQSGDQITVSLQITIARAAGQP